MIMAQPRKAFSILGDRLYFVKSVDDKEVSIHDDFGNLNKFSANRFNFLNINHGIGNILTSRKVFKGFMIGGFYKIVGIVIDENFDVWYKIENSAGNVLVKDGDLAYYFEI